MPLAELDLDLALSRLERDFKYGRSFYVHPYEIGLVNTRRAEWLEAIRRSLAEGTYRAATPYVANVPKGNGGVRPGALLPLADQVVYTAIVGSALEHLQPVLTWIDPPKDYANQVRDQGGVDWLSVPYRCWKAFRERSVALLEAAPAVVVLTDITGFYEHIDHDTLVSDLRGAGVGNDLLTVLSQSVGRWSSINGRGLPQNLAASHLLAKLYLTRIDHALHEHGFVHVRYVDDTRLFCSSTAEAKRALMEFAVLLRARGLTLQSAKTEILLPVDARSHIEGIAPVLRPLARQFVEQIAQQAGLDPQYMTVREAEALVTDHRATIPIDVLRAAYHAHFLAGDARFDKTLFHFLIRRLGNSGDAFATNHCLSLFEEKPEESDDVLAYLAKIGGVGTAEDRLLRYLESAEAVYDYQVVQFLQWRTRVPQAATDHLLAFARQHATAANAPYLRTAARSLLGRFGSEADLDELMRAYGAATSDMEHAELICSTARVERGQRNAFLGRVRDDGFLASTAAAGVRAGRDWYEA